MEKKTLHPGDQERGKHDAEFQDGCAHDNFAKQYCNVYFYKVLKHHNGTVQHLWIMTLPIIQGLKWYRILNKPVSIHLEFRPNVFEFYMINI